MMEAQTNQIIIRAVTNILKKEVVEVLKNQQQNIQQGTILSYNLGSHTAQVRVYDTSLTLSYPAIYDTVISNGKKCIVLSVDPKNLNNKFIVGIY